MLLLFIIVVMIICAVVLPRFIKDIPFDRYNSRIGSEEKGVKSLAIFRWGIRGVCLAVALVCFLGTSCLIISPDEVGHLKKIYGGSQMAPGRIIAMPWEKGPQAKILPPGFHLIPFVRVLNDIETKDIVQIEQGHYGFLVAKDGKPLDSNKFIADAWKNKDEMINALKFMGYTDNKDDYKGPIGTKGPQLTVIPPGNYRINRYLFDVFAGTSTPVKAGYVAVIKSNVGEDYKGPSILPSGVKATDLSVPIVPKNYRGVWETVFPPGEYYINQKAYEVTLIPTRVQTWKYIGGYTRRWIDLTIGDNGKIEQSKREETVKVPDDAADSAVVLRIEGWDVFQDSRVQIQVTPENAPYVVAAVGGIEEVENKIITPNYRSIVRNVVAENVIEQVPVIENGKEVIDKNTGKVKTKTIVRGRKVLDLLYQRELLETQVADKLVPAGMQAGLTVQWVRFGDPVVPPELLVPGKRKQLAQQLMNTYKQERESQFQRVQTEKERARADQQAVLMKSEIGIKVADNNATAREKAGAGEEKYMKAVARGQLAQANVLGKEKAFELAYIKEVLAAATSNPDIIKYPGTLVVGAGGSLEGAAAILGRSNLNMGLKKAAEAK